MKPNFVILYVSEPQASAAFYAELLGSKIIESSPNFAMLPFNGETMLGLWKKESVLPKAVAQAGAQEVAISVAGKDDIDAVYAQWKARGIPFAQDPADMDFGRTCVALDQDGHRIRVLCAA